MVFFAPWCDAYNCREDRRTCDKEGIDSAH